MKRKATGPQNVYVLTRYKERFNAMREFLLANGYAHVQAWEKSEEDVTLLKQLNADVRWKKQLTVEDVVSIENIEVRTLGMMEVIMRGNCGDWKTIPNIFIVDFDLLFVLTAEHVYQLVVSSLLEMFSELPAEFRFMYVMNDNAHHSIELNTTVGHVQWHRNVKFGDIEKGFSNALYELVTRDNKTVNMLSFNM